MPALVTEEGAQVKAGGQPLKAGKGSRHTLPWSIQKEPSAADTLTLARRDPCQTSGLQNWKMRNEMFQATEVMGICWGSNRKLIQHLRSISNVPLVSVNRFQLLRPGTSLIYILFINLVLFLATGCSMWDLSSPTRA